MVWMLIETLMYPRDSCFCFKALIVVKEDIRSFTQTNTRGGLVYITVGMLFGHDKHIIAKLYRCVTQCVSGPMWFWHSRSHMSLFVPLLFSDRLNMFVFRSERLFICSQAGPRPQLQRKRAVVSTKNRPSFRVDQSETDPQLLLQGAVCALQR